MKNFKIQLLSLLAAGAFLVSCEKKSTQIEVNNAPIEIEFIKEGDLVLKNNDSIIKKLDVEVANTDSERQIGLMNRSSMLENRGMIFVFDEDNTSGFWMKDTRIPLDIIFVGQDSTVINVQKNAKPYDEHNYPATAPYRYVLEVNGGSADKWGVKDGETKLSWKVTDPKN